MSRAAAALAVPAPAAQGLAAAAIFQTFRRETLRIGAASVLLHVLLLTPTIYMLQVYDRVLAHGNVWTLLVLSLAALGAFALMAVVEAWRGRWLVGVGVRLDERLGPEVLQAGLARNHEPRAAKRAFADLTDWRQFLTGPGAFAAFDAPWTPIYVLVISLLDPWLGALALFFLCAQGGLAIAGLRQAARGGDRVRDGEAAASEALSDAAGQADSVVVLGMAGAVGRRWDAAQVQALAAGAAAAGQRQTHAALSRGLRHAQQLLTLTAGALLVLDGHISPGGMLAANVLMTRALAPIDVLAAAWPGFVAARAAYARLRLLFGTPAARDADIEAPTPPAGAGVIWDAPAPGSGLQLRGVTVRVEGQAAPLIEAVDLQVPRGELLVLRGDSGAGKSTLLKSMLGLWPGQEGSVLIDGAAPPGQGGSGARVGYLPQHPALLDGTLADNIARHAAPQAAQAADVVEAARAAGVHEAVLRLPQGYDTPAADAGRALSGGQRQAVCLARALYGEPDWVLLDEPDAHLDEAGEAALVAAVLALRARGAGVVIVARRRRVLALADRVVDLRGGRIVSDLRVPAAPQPAAQSTP